MHLKKIFKNVYELSNDKKKNNTSAQLTRENARQKIGNKLKI